MGAWALGGSVREHVASEPEVPVCPVGKLGSFRLGLSFLAPSGDEWLPVFLGGSQKHPGDVGQGCSEAEGGTSPRKRATMSKRVLLFLPHK